VSIDFEYYPERESKTLEFKSTLPKFPTLIKTCVAFTNTAGGQIIIGVEDNTRKIIGINDKDRERVYESFPNSLYDATNNGLFAHIYERNFNDRSVLMINVPLSTRRPCFIKQEGIPKGVYLRVGSSTRRAQKEHVEELMRESKHQYYDVEPTSATFEELSKSRLEQCYGKSLSPKKLESDGVITSLSISPQQYSATIAGVLMFSDQPEKIIPETIIICSEFSGTSGRNIIQTRELIGPIPDLIQESTSLLEHWLQRNFKLEGVKLTGKSPIPMEALREAITNGLLHRKYTIPGALKIALYEDRLEIFSPGGFPGLVDIKNLGDGTTYLRNPHLAMLARRLKITEKLGTGIKLIFDSCHTYGIKKPEYHEDGDFVKIIFYFSPSIEAGDTDEDVILKYMSMHKEAEVSDIIKLLDVSRNTATRKINNLIEKKLIMRKGSGPAVRYHIKSNK
jgi:ATP-dependent DNA helicase RecG